MIYSAQQLTQIFSQTYKLIIMLLHESLTPEQREFVLEQQIEYDIMILEGRQIIISEDIDSLNNDDDLPW